MAGRITFFKKNVIDIEVNNITITVTDAIATNTGQDFIDFIRNRNNTSAWLTSNSTDAASTQIDITLPDAREITDIILVKHNWKAFTFKYWDGSSYVDFSTPISETTNVDETTRFSFTAVEASLFRIIITGTQIADEDKELFQLIMTETILAGELEGYPEIKKPKHSTNRKKINMLSGKIHLTEALGAFSCQLKVKVWSNDNDMSLMEAIYFRRQGVLIWLSGGNETQFKTERIGYRLEDFFLVRPTNEYENAWFKSTYTTGNIFRMNLQEAIT